MENVIENNKILAVFMENTAHKYPVTDAVCLMFGYHESWDKLMTVINKIANDVGYTLVMASDYSYWNQFGENPLNEEFGGYEDISNIYQACVEFIKWYNENRPK